MATSFYVISLGIPRTGSGSILRIDPTEGNIVAENAGQLVGRTFGGPGDALADDVVLMSAVSYGSDGFYDQNNSLANDTFRINGGAAQTFDASVVYNATITYIDGSTATITAVVFQDTAGNLYFAPEASMNADQAAIEAMPIRSLRLNSLESNEYDGMGGDRPGLSDGKGGFQVCFTPGALIETARGLRDVAALRPGDMIRTRDAGLQPLHWVGAAPARAEGRSAPVLIRAGALGMGLPERDLLVSPQHRMLVCSRIAERLAGAGEVLVPACKLVGIPGVELRPDGREVIYLHLLLAAHHVIFAEGAPTESLLTGAQARRALGSDAVAEIEGLFPGVFDVVPLPARPIPPGRVMKELARRHIKNARPLLRAA